jgi:Pectate lyase superfamily protein
VSVAYDYPFGQTPIPVIDTTLNWQNVVDFGADPLGVNDSTQAIIKAIAAGNAIYFPPGTYIVSSGIQIPQNRWFYGVAGQSIIKQANGMNLGAVLMSGNFSVAGGLQFIDWENIYFDGLVFDGNGSTQTYTSSAPQCFMVLYGSNMYVSPTCRFQNCGGSAASNSTNVPTGLLMGASLENPPKASRLIARGVQFLNCYGVASWITNAKGGFISGGPSPDMYGYPGLSDVSFQSFYFCRNGLNIEDRCNGVLAYGIQYWGDSNFYQSAGGNAVSITYSTNIKGSVDAMFCASALSISAGTPGASGAWQNCDGVQFDVTARMCANAGARLLGSPAFSSTVNGALSAGAFSVPLNAQTNPNSVCANAWVLINDATNGSEWVQCAGPIVGNAIPLMVTTPTTLPHTSGATVIASTGLRHFQGRITAVHCGGTNDNAGLYCQGVEDSVIDLEAYDNFQYLAPLSQPESGVVQYYGAKINTSTRVTIRGTCYANRDTAFFDDGTNTNCEFVGMLGNINDAGTRQLAYAMRYSPQDATRPSVFMNSGAPSNALGKNGDWYLRADGTPGLFGNGTLQYTKSGGAWGPGRIAAQGRVTFSGDGATTTFRQAHGLGASPNHVNISLFACPTAALAGGYIVGWDGTNVWVTFAVAPAAAANNVAYDWEAWL